jgi:hypothetical protein
MDIDIDFADRERVLKLIKHVPAAINRKGEWVKHNTGVFVTAVPADPFTKLCSLDYNEAEDLGYVKLDLLNVHVYDEVKDEAHLDQLMKVEPEWEMLQHREFVERIIHINNHFDTLKKMPESVDTRARMAMFLAVIRPAKRHLIGRAWKDVANDIWTKPTDGSYYFKKAHAVSYAHLVAVHMNLLCGGSAH